MTEFYVVEAGKPDRLLMTLPNDDPPRVGTTIQFTGGAKHAWVVVEVHRVLGSGEPSVVKLKEITEEGALLLRYQRCVERLLGLFPHDPLPDACPAQSYVERLEALLDLDLLAPKYDNHLEHPPASGEKPPVEVFVHTGAEAAEKLRGVTHLLRLRGAVVEAALKLLHDGGYTALPPGLRAATIALDAELNKTPPPAVAAEMKVG